LLRPESEIRRGRLYHASERWFRWIVDRYESTLRWVIDHQSLMLPVTFATIAFTIFLYIVTPKGFFPQQDTGRLIGTIQADQSTSFQAMSRYVAQLADIVKQDPAVDNVIAFTGGGGSTTNVGRMFVALKPLRQRALSADQVIGRLRRGASEVS